MRRVVAVLLTFLLAACTTAQPTTSPDISSTTDASPAAASPAASSPAASLSEPPAATASGAAEPSPSQTAAASPDGESPSPAGSGVAGSTDEECAEDDEECFQAALEDAIALADQIPTRVEIEEPESFSGGLRTANWVVYLADTTALINRFWANAFAAGRVPYTNVSYVLIDAGQPPQRSACTPPGNVGAADAGPFYCPIGGSGFGRTFSTGTVYIGIPYLVNESRRVNVQNYDFAVITVVAHEMGHHVEHQLFRQNLAKPSTATWWELGADCLAGVFAHNAYFGRAGTLTDSDVWEGMQMLYNWGSDLPYAYSGDPHGSRQQRTDAFLYGYNNGNTSACLRANWPTDF